MGDFSLPNNPDFTEYETPIVSQWNARIKSNLEGIRDAINADRAEREVPYDFAGTQRADEIPTILRGWGYGVGNGTPNITVSISGVWDITWADYTEVTGFLNVTGYKDSTNPSNPADVSGGANIFVGNIRLASNSIATVEIGTTTGGNIAATRRMVYTYLLIGNV